MTRSLFAHLFLVLIFHPFGVGKLSTGLCGWVKMMHLHMSGST